MQKRGRRKARHGQKRDHGPGRLVPGAETPFGGDQQVDEHHVIGEDLQRVTPQQAEERPVEEAMEKPGSRSGAEQARLLSRQEQPADEIGQRGKVHDENETKVDAATQQLEQRAGLMRQIAPTSERSRADDCDDDARGGDGERRAVGPHHAAPVDPAGGGKRAENEATHEGDLPGEGVEVGLVLKTRLQDVEPGIHDVRRSGRRRRAARPPRTARRARQPESSARWRPAGREVAPPTDRERTAAVCP